MKYVFYQDNPSKLAKSMHMNDSGSAVSQNLVTKPNRVSWFTDQKGLSPSPFASRIYFAICTLII